MRPAGLGEREKPTHRGVVLDPRSKLLLLATIATIVLGGMGGSQMLWMHAVLSSLPLAMLAFSGRFVAATICAAAFGAAFVVQAALVAQGSGTGIFVLLLLSGIFSRMLPAIVAAHYLVTTTTVSEFVAGMHRMHAPDSIVIPLSVMFRFIPTVVEEATSIQQVMKMRGIRVGAGHPRKMLEYRLVPTMICSARIGEELSAAALTRGLGAPIARTNVSHIGFAIQDWIIIAICSWAFIAASLSMIGA